MKKIILCIMCLFCFTCTARSYHAAEQVDELINGCFMYTTNTVQYRLDPDPNSFVIETLNPNVSVFVTEQINSDYARCKIGNVVGYIYSDFLSSEPVETAQYEYLGNYKITGYKMFDASENGGRSDGVTASGVIGEPGRTVAMKGIDFGTRIYISGLGEYVVEDRGVGSGIIDVACWSTEECHDITGYYEVYLIKD